MRLLHTPLPFNIINAIDHYNYITKYATQHAASLKYTKKSQKEIFFFYQVGSFSLG